MGMMKAEIKERKNFYVSIELDEEGLDLLRHAVGNVEYDEMVRGGCSELQVDKMFAFLCKASEDLKTKK